MLAIGLPVATAGLIATLTVCRSSDHGSPRDTIAIRIPPTRVYSRDDTV